MKTDNYRIYADYGSTGFWVMSDEGTWLSSDPSKKIPKDFLQTLQDWMMFFNADRVRPNLGITQGCISLRMFNAIGSSLATSLCNEVKSPVVYQEIKEKDLFYKITNDINHIDHHYKI